MPNLVDPPLALWPVPSVPDPVAPSFKPAESTPDVEAPQFIYRESPSPGQDIAPSGPKATTLPTSRNDQDLGADGHGFGSSSAGASEIEAGPGEGRGADGPTGSLDVNQIDGGSAERGSRGHPVPRESRPSKPHTSPNSAPYAARQSQRVKDGLDSSDILDDVADNAKSDAFQGSRSYGNAPWTKGVPRQFEGPDYAGDDALIGTPTISASYDGSTPQRTKTGYQVLDGLNDLTETNPADVQFSNANKTTKKSNAKFALEPRNFRTCSLAIGVLVVGFLLSR